MVVGRSVRVSDDGPVDRPAIIIGDREKLNGEGPTLALIAAFERSMSSATHMVVVGYSFTDVHVNALIRSWANADDRRTISVIDPFWPARHDLEGFRSNLLEALRPLREISRFRMDVLRAGAEECLAVALDGVRERPAAPVSLHCVSTPHGNELHITNQYTGLRRLHISSPFSSPGNPNPPRTDIGDPNQQFGWAATHDAGSLDEDEVRVIRIDSEQTPGTDITFGIQASDHQDEWDYSVDVRWPGN